MKQISLEELATIHMNGKTIEGLKLAGVSVTKVKTEQDKTVITLATALNHDCVVIEL